MAGNLLLLADNDAYAQLNRYGHLAEPLLINAALDRLLTAVESKEPRIVRCAPDALHPDTPAVDDVLGRRGRAEVFNALQGSLIVYLAVIENATDLIPDEETLAGESGTSTAKVAHQRRSLEEHVHWYERFRDELRLCARDREDHFRHALILICGDNPPASELAHFNRLVAGEGDQKLFDIAYVMQEELEPGPGSYFNSCHVWPLAVGRLAVKLLHDPFEQPARKTQARAWRCLELAPAIDDDVRRKVTDRQFERLRQTLLEDPVAHDGIDATNFKEQFKPVPVAASGVELSRQQDENVEGWLDFNVREVIAVADDHQQWQAVLSKAGGEFSSRLSDHLLKESAAWSEIRRVWSAVHADPRHIREVLEQDPVPAAALSEQYNEITKRWQGIMARDSDRRERLAAAEEAGTVFEAAQGGFLSFSERMIVVGVITLLIGYVSLQLLATWTGPIAAMAGAAGAFLAAFVTWDREQAAGQRARESFDDLVKDVDQAMQDRHDDCQSSVRSADLFWQQLRSNAAAVRLRQLLRRLQNILDHEGRFKQKPLDMDDDKAPADSTQAASQPQFQDSQARRQRGRYLQRSIIEQKVDLQELSKNEQIAAIDQLVDKRLIEFRDDIWSAFCQESDPQRAGNLPACDLIPMLRDFVERFEHDLLGMLHRQAIQRIDGQGCEQWVSGMRSTLEYKSYFELMSCRILSHQTEASRYRAQLFLRDDFQHRELTSQLGGALVAEPVVISSLLSSLPTVGLLFHEMPVQFDAGPDGRIQVVEYRRRDEG